MEVQEKDDRLFISGKGTEFLRLKSSVAAKVGPALVRSEGRECFSIPMTSLALAIDVLSSSGIDQNLINRVERETVAHQDARNRSLLILQNDDEGSPLPHWDSVLDHLQAVAVNVMSLPGLKGLCLFDEQGAGKTVMALAAFDSLKETDQIDTMIVVCPKTMLKEWEKDFQRFLPEKYHIAVVEGDSEKRYNLALKPSDVLIVNFDSVSRICSVLESGAIRYRTLLVVDESFYVKNPEAIRSEAIRSLRRKCTRAFVLCGTPAPNSAADIVHQFDVADDGYTYAGFAPSGDVDLDTPRISEAMSNRGVYIRRLKTQLLPDLPEKYFQIVPVGLVTRQAQLYEEARHSLVLWLQGMDSKRFQRNLSTYFAKRQTLLQICSCPAEIDPLFVDTPAKLLVLDTLLEDIVTLKNRKVVIWTYYRRSLDEVAIRYERYGLVRVDGTTNGAKRREAIERFQADPEVKIFLGNPAAAGAGITLHAAADAIYLSYPAQAAHYLQSLDRIHRRGQTAAEVRYYLLVCRNTIEEGDVRRLRRKEADQQVLLRDEVSFPSSFDEALADVFGGAL